MVDDYPMVDDADRDAEMAMDDYDADYNDAAMADESGAIQLKEYDMEGDMNAEYEETMIAEPTVGGMVPEAVSEAPAPQSIPIVAAAPSLAGVAILPVAVPQPQVQPLSTSPQPDPIPVPVISELPPLTVAQTPAEIPTVLSPFVELKTNPITSATEAAEQPQTLPQPEIPTIQAVAEPAPTISIPPTESLVQETPEAPEPVVPGESSQNAAVTEAPADPQATTEEQSAVPPQVEEKPLEVIENLPTDEVVPPITVYFDEQSFFLFSAPPVDPQATAPVVILAGQSNLYAAPLAELLGSIRLQETEYLSGTEDSVFGFEYTDLDLCIDEVSLTFFDSFHSI